MTQFLYAYSLAAVSGLLFALIFKGRKVKLVDVLAEIGLYVLIACIMSATFLIVESVSK